MTWEEYKEKMKHKSDTAKEDIEEMELLADIVSSIIKKRDEMSLSQRDLAKLAGLPQSSIARIESFAVTPNIETILKILRPLGLTLIVVQNK